MKTTELTAASITAAKGPLPEAQPVFMLNLLRYKARADYGARQDVEPCSGREAYHQRYIPAFGKLAPAGIKVLWVGTAAAHLVAPIDEHWDEVAIVEYPSFQVFRELVESSAYLAEASHHRLAALADWRLIAMSKLQLG